MQPLFYAALALAGGIAAGTWAPPWLHTAGMAWVWGPLAVVALAGAARHRGWAGVAALACCCSFGFGRAVSALHRPGPASGLAGAMSALQPSPHSRVFLTGYVRDTPELLYNNGRPSAVRVEVQAVSVAAGEGAAGVRPVGGGVRLYAYAPGTGYADRADAPAGAGWARSLLALPAGQGLAVTVHLRPLSRYRDPGVADFTAAARRQGIVATATLPLDAWRRWPGVAGSGWLALRARLWRWLSRRLDRLAPPASAARLNGLLRGMLLGDVARLDGATRSSFQRDGVYHLLVVAGLHIGVLAGFLLLLFRWMRMPRAAAGLLTLALLGAYAWVIAGRTPTLRALLMLAVFFVAGFWYRQRQALNAAGFAALVLLVWRPLDLFTPSLQLTLGAATLLAGVALPIVRRTTQPLRRACRELGNLEQDAAFPPRLAQWRLDLREFATRLGWFWRPLGWRLLPAVVRLGLDVGDIVLFSLVLQLGFAGFNAVYFHRLTPWAVLANAVLVPAAGVLIPLAWLGVALTNLGGGATRVAAWAVGAWGGTMLRVADGLARWPGAGWRVPSPPGWMLVCFAAAVGAWIAVIGLARWPPAGAGRRWRSVGLATAAVSAAALAIGAAPFPPRLPPGLTATVLDVGQGNCTLVSFPDGRTLLVNAGPRSAHWDSGAEIVAPFLWSLGLRRVDAVLLTEAANENLGGVPTIVGDFDPGEVWVTRTLPQTAATRALLRQAGRVGARVRRTAAGDVFLAGAARIRVLLPPPGYRAGERPGDSDSMAVRIRFGGAALLLAGNAQAAGESWMVQQREPLASSLLEVGDHGSGSATSAAFLGAVGPRVAVVSVGAGNSYGQPSAAVLARLRRDGVRVFRTDRDGAVQCRFWNGRLGVYLFPPPPGG